MEIFLRKGERHKQLIIEVVDNNTLAKSLSQALISKSVKDTYLCALKSIRSVRNSRGGRSGSR